MKQAKELKFDKEKKRVVITTQEVLNIEGNADEAKKLYKERLQDIIRQVKGLKSEADEIKRILQELENPLSKS